MNKSKRKEKPKKIKENHKGFIKEIKSSLEIQKLLKEYNDENIKKANLGIKFTKKFIDWIKNHEKISKEEKIEYVKIFNKINENKEIEKYLYNRLKHSKVSYRKIKHNLEKIGIIISQNLISKLFTKMSDFEKELRKHKPGGYWKKWENVETELNEIKIKLNRFPVNDDFIKLKKRGLLAGITRYHGGLNAARIKIGESVDKKPPGYWSKWEILENELNKIIATEYKDKSGNIIKKVGVFPSKPILRKIKRTDIEGAIEKYHRGIVAVRNKIGYGLDTKPANYWKSWENFERELNEIIKELGHFPSQNELRELKRTDILQAVWNHFGGINAVRITMGYKLDNFSVRWKYYKERGYKTEDLVVEVLNQWAN
ncbi:MAG: hypothetical protein HWN67_10100 [Candidatus Helarchaeota archaeon]|nr:hypothetical protein [Candidatus Helarchaeota archaeon]